MKITFRNTFDGSSRWENIVCYCAEKLQEFSGECPNILFINKNTYEGLNDNLEFCNDSYLMGFNLNEDTCLKTKEKISYFQEFAHKRISLTICLSEEIPDNQFELINNPELKEEMMKIHLDDDDEDDEADNNAVWAVYYYKTPVYDCDFIEKYIFSSTRYKLGFYCMEEPYIPSINKEFTEKENYLHDVAMAIDEFIYINKILPNVFLTHEKNLDELNKLYNEGFLKKEIFSLKAGMASEISIKYNNEDFFIADIEGTHKIKLQMYKSKYCKDAEFSLLYDENAGYFNNDDDDDEGENNFKPVPDPVGALAEVFV